MGRIAHLVPGYGLPRLEGIQTVLQNVHSRHLVNHSLEISAGNPSLVQCTVSAHGGESLIHQPNVNVCFVFGIQLGAQSLGVLPGHLRGGRIPATHGLRKPDENLHHLVHLNQLTQNTAVRVLLRVAAQRLERGGENTVGVAEGGADAGVTHIDTHPHSALEFCHV